MSAPGPNDYVCEFCRGSAPAEDIAPDDWWVLRDWHGLQGLCCRVCYQRLQDPEQRAAQLVADKLKVTTK